MQQRDPKRPRHAQVTVHRVCNIHCVHCTTRESPERDTTQLADVVRSIEQAKGADVLSLSGGEPLLHPKILSLVAHAKKHGIRRVLLETNGLMLAQLSVVQKLKAAGLDGVQVNLPSLNPAIYGAITQREEALSWAIQGITQAKNQELSVGIRVVVLPENVSGLNGMMEELVRRWGNLNEVVFELPDLGLEPLGVRYPKLYVPYEQLGPALVEAATTLNRANIPHRFAPGLELSPCAVPDPGSAPALFVLREGMRREKKALTMAIEPCSECAAVQACAGFRRDHARMGAHHQTGGLKKRMLRVLRDQEEVTRKDDLIFVNVHDNNESRTVFLRTNYHCNQACEFCYIDRTLPNHDAEAILREIRRTISTSKLPVRMIFTGGEPTLNPHLKDFCLEASSLGAHVGLQTNAVRLADAAVLQPLLDAGLAEAFVSLHGASAAVGDTITEAPGTWAKTLVGVDKLLAGNVQVRLNFVMTHANAPELEEFAKLVLDRWQQRVDVTFSLAVPTGEASGKGLDVTPRMRELEAPLSRALRVLKTGRVSPTWSTVGAGCMTAPCTVGELELLDIPWNRPARIASDPQYIKTQECERCAIHHLCPGLREEYVEAYGTLEIRPFPKEVPLPTGRND